MVNRKYIFLSCMLAFMMVYVGSIFYGTSVPMIASEIDANIEIPQNEYTSEWNESLWEASGGGMKGMWSISSLMVVIVLILLPLVLFTMRMGMR